MDSCHPWVCQLCGAPEILDRNTAVVATLSALIAQTGWFLIGAVAVPDQLSAVFIDIVINAVLLGAVFIRPGYVSAGLAIAWNIFGIIVNVSMLTVAEFGEQRALAAHIALRLIIVASAAMIIIYKGNPDLLPGSDEDGELYT
jgi:Na+-translocating ferredoxin:NAD+ oxidoreductase RnfD subunit